jgi:OmpA-OmpF porin, OOP family
MEHHMNTKNTEILIALSVLLALGGAGCKKKAKISTPPVTEGAVSLDEDTGLLRLKRGTSIQFATGSDQLLDESKPTLNDVVKVMTSQNAIKIRVEGHTDSDGEEAKNLELSSKRAASVKAYLESQGIAADRISSEGCGETAPLADNATDEGKQQNRRVVFVLLRGPRTSQVCKVYKPLN